MAARRASRIERDPGQAAATPCRDDTDGEVRMASRTAPSLRAAFDAPPAGAPGTFARRVEAGPVVRIAAPLTRLLPLREMRPMPIFTPPPPQRAPHNAELRQPPSRGSFRGLVSPVMRRRSGGVSILAAGCGTGLKNAPGAPPRGRRRLRIFREPEFAAPRQEHPCRPAGDAPADRRQRLPLRPAIAAGPAALPLQNRNEGVGP